MQSSQSPTIHPQADVQPSWLVRLQKNIEDISLFWKLIGLISLLIMLAGVICYLAVQTTEKYVIQREIMDLQDETQIAKLTIEKRLSSIQSKVLANIHLLQPDGTSTIHSKDPQFLAALESFGKQCDVAEQPTFLDGEELEEICRFPESAQAQGLTYPRKLLEDVAIWLLRAKSSRNATDAFWSNIEWQTTAQVNAKKWHKSAGVSPTKSAAAKPHYLGDDVALVTLVVPIMRGSNKTTATAAAVAETELSGEAATLAGIAMSEGFVFVKFDITDTLAELFDPRSFVTLVNSEMQPVLLPFGRTKSNDHRMGKYLAEILDQYQDSVNNSPDALKEGKVYPQPEPGQQAWKKFADVFDISVTSPLFAESQDLSLPAVEGLTKNEEFKNWQAGPPPPGDPLRAVTIPSESFRRIRVRASNLEALTELKQRIAGFVGKETVYWNSARSQSDIVVNVHAIEAPGQSGGLGSQTEQRPFLYLVRGVAEKEISGAVHSDLEGLIWYCIMAVAASMFLAFLCAALIIRPLRIMSRLARHIGSLELSQTSDIQQAQQLIAELPIGNRNEAGILGFELKGMVERLLAANSHLQTSQTALQQARDSLDMRVKIKTRELQQQRDIADEASRAKSIFLATTSHDMRQPLHVVFTHCELLRDSGLSDEQTESLDFIEKNATRLKYLTNDILDYQRLLSGEIILRSEDVHVASMLSELTDHMQDKAEEGNNQLHVRCDFPNQIHIDRPRLERILVNLLSNACKFTRRGNIELSAYPVGQDMIEFRVQDTGQGMNEAQQKRLFEPLMTSRHRGHDGTGLGLYICKGITESMGGQLRFESKLNVGTTFYVSLPVRVESTSEATPDSTAGNTAKPNPAEKTTASPVTARIAKNQPHSSTAPANQLVALIIDDDDDARRVLADILTRQGYKTLEADNGEKGLAIAREQRPDIISLDVIMPDMDGWQVLAELKADTFTESIPVVMATVLPDIQKGNVLGADGYVTKPFSTSSVSSAIEKALLNRTDDLILIVDDEQAVRQDLRRLIESCGWRVVEAADGLEALEVVATQIPGLAIVDLDMPNMDGFALIEKFRQMPETEHLPIIVLSALTLGKEQQVRLQRSVNRFFGKGGLDLPELNQEITRLLQRHHANESLTNG